MLHKKNKTMYPSKVVPIRLFLRKKRVYIDGIHNLACRYFFFLLYIGDPPLKKKYGIWIKSPRQKSP